MHSESRISCYGLGDALAMLHVAPHCMGCPQWRCGDLIIWFCTCMFPKHRRCRVEAAVARYVPAWWRTQSSCWFQFRLLRSDFLWPRVCYAPNSTERQHCQTRVVLDYSVVCLQFSWLSAEQYYIHAVKMSVRQRHCTNSIGKIDDEGCITYLYTYYYTYYILRSRGTLQSIDHQ